jgi:hypothetical protein
MLYSKVWLLASLEKSKNNKKIKKKKKKKKEITKIKSSGIKSDSIVNGLTQVIHSII